MSSAATPFRLQVASDLKRDGLAVELLDEAGDVVAEVFRSDATRTVRLTTFQHELPLAAIEHLITVAKSRLDPFEDGAPLSTSNDLNVVD